MIGHPDWGTSNHILLLAPRSARRRNDHMTSPLFLIVQSYLQFYLTYKLRRVWITKYSSSAEQPVSTGESQGNVVGGKQKESCALKEEQVLKKYNKWFVTMWWDFLYIWHDWTSRLTPIQSYPTISSLFSSPQKWSYDFPPFSWSSSHIFNCLDPSCSVCCSKKDLEASSRKIWKFAMF